MIKRVGLSILVGFILFLTSVFVIFADGPERTIIVTPTENDPGFATFTSSIKILDFDNGAMIFEQQFPIGSSRVIAAQVKNGNLYYHFDGQFHQAAWPISGAISVTKSYSAVGYPVIDIHEFNPSNDGSMAAFVVYDNIITDTSAYGGFVTGTVINNIIQIISTEDNSLLAERDLSLTYPISETNQSYVTSGPVRTYHINSIDFSPDDSLLMVNMKHYGLLILDVTQPDLPTVAFLGIDEHQEHHDMRWHHLISDSTYLVSGFSNNPSGVSAGVVYHLNVGSGEITEQYHCDNPGGFTSLIMGSVDYNSNNGEMLVGWGASVGGGGIVAPPTMYTRFDSGCDVLSEGPAGLPSYWARVADIELYQYYFPLMFGSGGISVE